MEQSLVIVSMVAGQDLSAKQYHFVTFASDGQVDPTGDGLNADGVLQNDPSAAGQAASVGIAGISKVVSGAAVTKGAQVASSSAGRGVPATSGERVLGRALTASGADGEVISVLLKLAGEPNVS